MNARLTLAATLAAAVTASLIPGLADGDAPPLNSKDAPEFQIPEAGPLKVGTLHLRAGNIETADLQDARQGRLNGFAPDKRYIVQLDGPITPERRAALENMGIKLGDYLPAYAYVAQMDGVDGRQLGQANFINWIGEYQDNWKTDPELGRRQHVTQERVAMRDRGELAVEITLFPGAESRNLLADLRAMGAIVHYTAMLGRNMTVSATIHEDDVDAIVDKNVVQYIEDAPEITPRNDEVRWVVQSNELDVTPLYANGLTGEGQIVGVLDTALSQTHCMFEDSAPIGPSHRKIVAYHPSPGSSSHGTHVSGTVAGHDLAEGSNRVGVAYHGKIAYNTWPSFNEAAILQRFNLAHSDGARIHTNSWGDDGTTAYNGLTRGIDVFQWENESSQTFWAVTNTSTMKNPENAKNTLAVGATEKAPSQHQHCTGGTGPTDDNRRKPEIYAPGCNTVSASSFSSCGTTSNSGTSMASPAVAGVGMLARQYYMDGYYPTGEPASGEPFEPSGALVKATLLNSAVDMTGVSGYPSNQEGWGRVLADDALYFLEDDRRLFVVDIWNDQGLSTGQLHEELIHVNSSSEMLKVTLVWTDYPGSAGTNFAAVNDLDLEVVGPNGTFLGNVFAGGVSTPGGTKDDRNNVEQVHIPNPGAGAWTIRVKGAAVNESTQGFALVATGDIDVQEPPLIVSLPEGAPGLIPAGEPATFDVRVADGEEEVVPGSEKLFYRFDGGSFSSVDLQPNGGEMYEATLPAPTCDSVPEFYVQAEGDGGTVRTSPANAPDSLYQAVVGEIAVEDVLAENFNDGLPSGWTTSGLWNVTSACSVSDPCDGGQWAYYGQTGGCNYDAGENEGSMTSAPISIPDVPPGGDVTLSFCYNLDTEASSTYDKATLSVVGGQEVELSDSSSWTEYTMDLTQYAGETIQLRWHFDTVDGIANNHDGWQIDAVAIVAEGLVCEDPEPLCPSDLSGDGVVNVTDMLQLLGEWGACEGCDADLDGNGNVNVSDLLLLLGDWGDC